MQWFWSVNISLLFIFLGVASGEEGDDHEDIRSSDIEALVDDLGDINGMNRKSEILDELLLGYDAKIRPKGQTGSGPVLVYVNIFLRNIENVDDVRMEYSAQITFRQSWKDPRLTFTRIQKNVEFLHLRNHSRIWAPDVFFENEKKGTLHKIVLPNIFTRIYPEGDILQSFRFTLLLSCPMNLAAYPLDVQNCPLLLSTYGYSTQDVILNWSMSNPIQYKPFRMPQFHINSYRNKLCTTVTAVDTFSCLELEIEMERAFGFFLIQFYIPCAMVVLVSWVGFWLEPTAVEARVSLGVTTVLTIVSQIYGINQSVPPASYIKALDIWTATCQVLIIGGLVQFALVNYTSKLTSPALIRLQSLKSTRKGQESESEDDAFDEFEAEMMRIGMQKAKRIDRISRVLFPAIFFTFNVLYWTSYKILY